MTALSFVWVHPYSQNSGCDIKFTKANSFRQVTLAMRFHLNIDGNKICFTFRKITMKN